MSMRFQGFAGMAPRIDRRFLKDNQAQEATNCRLTSGALDALRAPGVRHDPENGNVLAMFRMTDEAGVERWLSWPTDVDVQRSPVSGDTLQRIYWTGDGEPRTSTFAQVFTGSGPFPGGSGSEQFVLGCFPPDVAPTVGHTGGGATNITIAFAYTFVNARGEESQPSPAGTHTAPSDATSWNLSGMQAPPANSYSVSAVSWSGGVLTVTCSSTRGLRAGEEVTLSLLDAAVNGKRTIASVLSGTQVTFAMAVDPVVVDQTGTIARVAPHNYGTGAFKRIYATVTGANGVAEYRLWADNVAIAATTHSAAYSATAIAAATAMPSADWAMPPARMRGLHSMPNGIMAGFVDNEVCFCEPFLPHAWPVGYRQSVPSRIVGIGGFGTTLVIGTIGKPHTINGVDPQTMGGGANVIEQPWPCLSKRGMTSADWGVLYPTALGLALIGPGGAEIATRSLYTEEEWRVLHPASFVASTVDSLYAAAFTKADGVTRQVILLNKAEFSDLLLANITVDEFWTDQSAGILYMAHDGLIYRWDDPDSFKTLFDWFSKDVLLAPPQNFAAAKVDADFSTTPEQQAAIAAANAATIAANQAVIDSDMFEGAYGLLELAVIEIGGELLETPLSLAYESLQFQLFSCNERVFTKTLNSDRAFKLPAGYLCDTVAVRVTGNVKVRGVVLGRSMNDLRGI